jgi:hypothetical protein
MQKNKTLCSVIVQSGIGDSSNCRIAKCKTQKNIRNGLGDYDAACCSETLKKLVAIAATLLVVSAGTEVPLEGSG